MHVARACRCVECSEIWIPIVVVSIIFLLMILLLATYIYLVQRYPLVDAAVRPHHSSHETRAGLPTN